MTVKLRGNSIAGDEPRAVVYPMSDDIFLRLKETVGRKSGIQIQDRNRDALQVSLLDRMKFRGMESYDEYLDHVVSDRSRGELKHLMDLVTVNETHFFRNPVHMRVLRETILPEISRRPGKKHLSIWSAGCATGEEPYSISILLLETRPLFPKWDVELVGTDISQGALDVAKEGVYRARSLRDLDERMVKTYFMKNGNLFHLKQNVKNAVQFRFSNLIDTVESPKLGPNWDIIFCRNVMIYFSLETRADVVDRLHGWMNESSYLFLGHSESLFGVHDGYRLEELHGCFIYRPLARIQTFSSVISSSCAQEPKHQDDSAFRDGGGEPKGQGSGMAIQVSSEDRHEAELELGETETSPKVREKLLQALVLMNRSRGDEASRICHSILSKQPNCAEAHFLLGVIQSENGMGDRAIMYFHVAIALRPNLVMALFQKAEVESRMGRIQRARESYRGVIKILRHEHSDSPVRMGGGLSVGLLVATCRRKVQELAEA